MRGVVVVAVLLALRVESDNGFYSIICSGSSCERPTKGRFDNATAFASFDDKIELTGWATLDVGSGLHDDADAVAFAAGYLEGYLTANRTLQMLQNYKHFYKLDPLPVAVSQFLDKNDEWIYHQLQQESVQGSLWDSVRFIYSQLNGTVAGVNARLGGKHFTRKDALLLNLQGDIEELMLALNASAHPKFGSMTAGERERWELTHSHCSAIVKLLPDGSDLLVGHNMWWGYYAMLKVFKHYSFPHVLGGQLSSVSFSSYPGMLASTDDFYQTSSRLVVMETTNPVFNISLYASVKPQALFYWVRAMAANYLARSGPEWMLTFKQYNSGTYNNMWMVVDYNLFRPQQKHKLSSGILTVGEQLPGYFHFEDQTAVLSYGYWPSYNRALYPETSRLSGQDDMAARYGDYYSYQFTARAEIFRRDQGTIHGEADMKRILRYNKFQTDPLAHGKPCWQLACRGDLEEPVSNVGAIDAKVTSFTRAMRGETVVVAGPTHDDQPVFDWRLAPESVRETSHVGHPLRFDFGWVTMRPLKVADSSTSVLV